MIDTTDQQLTKNVVRLCPLLSSAITYEKRDGVNAGRRVHEIARSPCLKGECVLFDIAGQRCGLVRK